VCRGDEVLMRQIGNRDKADMRILAIEGTAGQRLVHICEPVGADKIGIFGTSAQKAGVGGATFALLADSDDPLSEQASICQSKMKFADQGGLPRR